jgi:hypothetical protein
MGPLEWQVARMATIAGFALYGISVLIAAWLRPSAARKYSLLAQLGVGAARSEVHAADLPAFRRYWRWLRIMVMAWVVTAGLYFGYIWVRAPLQ